MEYEITIEEFLKIFIVSLDLAVKKRFENFPKKVDLKGFEFFLEDAFLAYVEIGNCTQGIDIADKNYAFIRDFLEISYHEDDYFYSKKLHDGLMKLVSEGLLNTFNDNCFELIMERLEEVEKEISGHKLFPMIVQFTSNYYRWSLDTNPHWNFNLEMYYDKFRPYPYTRKRDWD